MQIAVLGIDFANDSCSAAALDGNGAVVKRRRVWPGSVVAFAKELPTRIVAMAACRGASYPGRLRAKQGLHVRLMSPEYVRPFVGA